MTTEPPTPDFRTVYNQASAAGPRLGSRWREAGGHDVHVIAVALDPGTLTPVVVYRDTTTGVCYVCTLGAWEERVEVPGGTAPRFAPV